MTSQESSPLVAAQQLPQVVRTILDSDYPCYSLLYELNTLKGLVERQASFQFDHSVDIASGETRLNSGLAVSPTQAALCINEVSRTVAFFRGLHQAIGDARAANPSEKVRVLYAGCGPYALLAIPQLATYAPDEVSFTLLDCHQQCLDSAKAVIAGLDLTDFAVQYRREDACQYRIPESETPHVIVSETMNVCLRNEPQVTITRHLLSQAPDAMLVPQAVSVDAALVNLSREHASAEANVTTMPDRERVMLGRVFALNAQTVSQWTSLHGDRLPAATIQIPTPLQDPFEARLLTRIEVYDDLVLQDYDCSLTIPQGLPVEHPIVGGEVFEFYYQLGSVPGLNCVAAT